MTDPNSPEDMQHHRSNDPPVKITRDIPLPWLLGLLGAFFVFAATMYFTQQRQAELLIEMKAQMQKLIDGQDSKLQKDLERDFDIREMKGRVAALERERSGVKR